SHTAFAVDTRELADLDDDLRPHRDLIANGLTSIMVTHVSFPAIDSRPASLSSWWIGDYLRGELRFKGAVISDDLSMTGAAKAGTAADRVRAALDAGCDLAVLCNAPDEVPAVLKALEGYVNPA